MADGIACRSTVRCIVQPERPSDRAAVRALHDLAFGRAAEGRVVEALRDVEPRVSLVARLDGEVVGHILFTAVRIESPGATWSALGLAPMAVHPLHQRRGIGSALVREGLRACAALEERVVVVLGHPDYYPRFGFRSARPLDLSSEFPAPDEAFMVAELSPGALAGRTGLVRYRPEFGGASPPQ
jgi:putative acetyltransferase